MLDERETVDLDIDEANELLFKIKIEGTDQPVSNIRLVCESKDMSYMFPGRTTSQPDEVQFDLPILDSKLTEGVYSAHVEVMVDNRYFLPVKFNINLKKTLKVVAESAIPVKVEHAKEIKVTTSAPVIIAKKQNVVITQPPQTQQTQNQTFSNTLKDRYLKRSQK